jgi:serine/threonine-protein kinase Chk2
VSKVIPGKSGQQPVKVYEKNTKGAVKEAGPAALRAPEEFIKHGGKGDPILYNNTADGSIYVPEDVGAPAKAVKGK